MNLWHEIPTQDGDLFNAIIEIPQGSINKYEYHKEYNMIALDRVLHASMHYPRNYGFLPQTYGDDKDPLDVLVWCKEPLPAGCLVEVRLIGVVYMVDGGEEDEKLLAVAAKDPNFKSVKDIKDLPEHQVKEVEHFFLRYKDLENKKTEITGHAGREEALQVVDKCIKLYKEKFNK